MARVGTRRLRVPAIGIEVGEEQLRCALCWARPFAQIFTKVIRPHDTAEIFTSAFKSRVIEKVLSIRLTQEQ